MGVRYVQVNSQIQERNDLPVNYGALVIAGGSEMAVVPGSPAEKAGIIENDLILSIDGVSLEGKSLASVIRSKSVGDLVRLRVLRGERERTVQLTLERAPAP